MFSRNCRCLSRRFGVTLVELLTSVSLVGVLVSLMLPGIQSAREASRSIHCSNNLKQLGLGLANYADAHKMLPSGARIAPYRTTGVSWLVEVLPYIEEDAISDRYDKSSLRSGNLLMHGKNRAVVDGYQSSIFLCPSSPLPPLHPIGLSGSQVMMPSYVGIAGATSHDGFPESRVSWCCVPAIDGKISAGGAMPPNRRVTFEQVTDGTSKTICLAESSDYAYSASGQAFRIDGGFPSGWVTGAMSPGVPPEYLGARPAWNITSVRYRLSHSDYDQPGVHENRGANNPLLSAHPGVVHAVMVDGSVRRLADSLPLAELKQMATRDSDSLPAYDR